jgi:hypothetical protein
MPRKLNPPAVSESPDNGCHTLLFKTSSTDKYYSLEFGGWDTELADAHLDLLPPGVENLIIRRKNGNSTRPLKLSCTPTRLGQQGLKALGFACIVEGLETDEIFSECKTLEQLWIGGHERPLLGTVENLKRLPLKILGFEGWGRIRYPSPALAEFVKSRQPSLSIGRFRY